MPHKSEVEIPVAEPGEVICEDLPNGIPKDQTDEIVKTIGSNCDIIVKAKGLSNSINLNNALNLKATSGTIIPLTNNKIYSSEPTSCSSNNTSSTNSNSGSFEDLTKPAEQLKSLTSDFTKKIRIGTDGGSSLEVSDDETSYIREHGFEELINCSRNSTILASLESGVQDFDIDQAFGSFQKKTISLSPSSTSSNLSVYNNEILLGDLNHTEMSQRPKKIYKVVLTGGPCGGKTTGQARLSTFFEGLGWKVCKVPEAANIILQGGIKFKDLTPEQALRFQERLLRIILECEDTYFDFGPDDNRDTLIICDRGTMDASAFLPRHEWEGILNKYKLNEVNLRDTRYNQIIHMVSAANGAEPFYTTVGHASRTEGMELARELDQKAAQAWVGHPYFDVVDNSTDFETKVNRMIQCVCQRLGIDARDRLQTNARKVKYLIKTPLPDKSVFAKGFQDFIVVHDYLLTNGPKMQARLRKRGQKGHWSYTYTIRRPELHGQVVEVKTPLMEHDYMNMLSQRDDKHVTVYKTRRCFLQNDQYFQLDIYEKPCHPRCQGLVLLETYSTLSGDELKQRLPGFLEIVKEVTGDPRYSMFNLSLKENWANNENFSQSLAGAEYIENNGINGRSDSICRSEPVLAGHHLQHLKNLSIQEKEFEKSSQKVINDSKSSN